MPTFTDNLNGTAGDLLHNRAGWSRSVGADSLPIGSGGTGLRVPNGTSNASSTWHAPTTQPSGADQYASALLTASSANQFPLGVRCNTTIALGDGYMARRSTSAGQLQLYRRSPPSGTFTLLGSYESTSTILATNPVTLKAVGNQISLVVQGITVIGPVTDTIIASGSAAMLTRGATVGWATVVDDWESGDVASAGVSATGTGSFAATTASATGSGTVKASGTGSFAATQAAGSAAGVLAGATAQGAGTFAATTASATGAARTKATGQGAFAPTLATATGAGRTKATGQGIFAATTAAGAGLLPLRASGTGSFAATTATALARARVGAQAGAQFAPVTAAARAALDLLPPSPRATVRVGSRLFTSAVRARGFNSVVGARKGLAA